MQRNKINSELNQYFDQCLIQLDPLFQENSKKTKETYFRTLKGFCFEPLKNDMQNLDKNIIVYYMQNNPTNQVLSIGNKLMKILEGVKQQFISGMFGVSLNQIKTNERSLAKNNITINLMFTDKQNPK